MKDIAFLTVILGLIAAAMNLAKSLMDRNQKPPTPPQPPPIFISQTFVNQHSKNSNTDEEPHRPEPER